jgi:signal transduction histidine kinase
MRQVRQATGRRRRTSSAPARADQGARRLGETIDRKRPEIERRWLERVQTVVDRTGIEATQLRDGLPDYLAALVELLTQDDAERSAEPPSKSAWWKVAREHGITRVRIGFDISQLIREFIILRQVIREVSEEDGKLEPSPEMLLADILEAGISAAVQAYVEARDFDARRKQAEHIGFLTHELRNPLSTATIAASQLRAHSLPEQAHLLDIIERGHKRLSDLIDSVLATERLEAGRVEPHAADVKLGQIMEGAVEAARASAAQKGLGFTVRYDAQLEVGVDPLLTRSAIQNLADNAVRYTDNGEVDVSVEIRNETFVIHVRDTCAGISAEELVTIFEPFKRGSTGKAGTGLGLAIAKRAVELQGGRIDAESPGQTGCHFWIELPKRLVQRK